MPVLKVEEITLTVEGLRAHVAVLAELADLVKLSVGADVELDKVELTIKGIVAQALLKVRLEQVRAILDKALTTIGENPEILQSLVQTVDRTVGEVGGVAREAVGEGGAVSQLTEGVGEATQRVGDAAGQAVGQVGQTANQAVGHVTEQAGSLLEETVNEAGQTVQRVVDESGSVVERTLNESGEVLDEAVVGNTSDLTSEEEHTADLEEHSESSVPDEEELNATSAARQKAEELGVDLSQITGSGVGDRITVRDVIQAAQG